MTRTDDLIALVPAAQTAAGSHTSTEEGWCSGCAQFGICVPHPCTTRLWAERVLTSAEAETP